MVRSRCDGHVMDQDMSWTRKWPPRGTNVFFSTQHLSTVFSVDGAAQGAFTSVDMNAWMQRVMRETGEGWGKSAGRFDEFFRIVKLIVLLSQSWDKVCRKEFGAEMRRKSFAGTTNLLWLRSWVVVWPTGWPARCRRWTTPSAASPGGPWLSCPAGPPASAAGLKCLRSSATAPADGFCQQAT